VSQTGDDSIFANWFELVVVVVEMPLNESDSEAERKAKIYYSSCMDVNKTIESLGSEPLLNLLRWFGGWTVSNTSGTFNATAWSFVETLERMHSFGLMNFFNIWVSDDEKIPTRNVIQVT